MSIVSNPKNDELDIEKLSIIKKYFSRIFTVLNSDIRHQLEALDIPENKKKKIRKELAFLPISKQKEYLQEIRDRSEDI